MAARRRQVSARNEGRVALAGLSQLRIAPRFQQRLGVFEVVVVRNPIAHLNGLTARLLDKSETA